MTPKAAPLKAVFFDLDGTLIDTAPDFHFVLNTLLAQHRLEPLPLETVRGTVSMGARALVTLGFGCQEDDERFEPLRQALLELYDSNLANESRPFPGMARLLECITRENLSWGVVTNKPAVYAEKVLAAMPLPRCPVLICPDHVSARKPDPESLYRACESAGCEPAEAVYIGDHPRDIQCGINAGMPTIACRYGYVPPGEDIQRWGADAVVEAVDDILPVLRRRLN